MICLSLHLSCTSHFVVFFTFNSRLRWEIRQSRTLPGVLFFYYVSIVTLQHVLWCYWMSAICISLAIISIKASYNYITVREFNVSWQSAFLNLLWDEHVKGLASSCYMYTTLASLRKIKHFTPNKLRKHLAESPVLSKLDYCDTVMFPLPQHLLKRLQRIQFAAASFSL